MSENKFIKHLKGEDTAKSVLEIKNQRTTTSFANMPDGNTSNANDVFSDHRGDAVGVLKGTENWKLDRQNLVETTTVYGDGRDFSNSTYEASGNGLWVDASCTFATSKRFAPNTKFVLKLCGHDLETVINHTVDFTLIVKFGVSNLISKTFTVTEEAFNFCKEFVIDFAESNSSTIKADAGSTMQIQLLCADANARAVIYNGMTVFTALQRRVDGDAVASDKKTFDEVVQDIIDISEELDNVADDLADHIANKTNPHEVTKSQVGLGNCDNTSDLDKPISTATQNALDSKVDKSGDTMTGALSILRASSSNTSLITIGNGTASSRRWNFLPSYNVTSLSVYSGTSETGGYRFTLNGFVPASNNVRELGSSSLKWKAVYAGMLNNGANLVIPNKAGTLATMDDVELAAQSGTQLTEQGVWYAKMYAATVAPSAADGTNYADFSQTDGKGNPIIVTYNRVNGAWVQDKTITPPAEYDGYITVTSKIWDIAEQAGQQGGRVLWNHTDGTFTPYPLIVSFEDIEVTGNSTVIMPQNPGANQIVNKDYVDEAIASIPTPTVDVTQSIDAIMHIFGGNPVINGSIVSGFGNSSFLELPGAFKLGASDTGSFEINCAFTTQATEDTNKKVILVGYVPNQIVDINLGGVSIRYGGYAGQKIEVLINGANDTQTITGTTDLLPATKYYVKIEYDGTNYKLWLSTDGSAYTLETSDARTVLPAPAKFCIGRNFYHIESVDMSGWNISKNGQMIWAGMDAPGLHQKANIDLSNIPTNIDYVVESQLPTAQNNYTWYRKYKSGWVEQGGFNHSINLSSSGSSNMINLPVTMADTNYTALAILCSRYGGRTIGVVVADSTTAILVIGGYASSSGTSAVNWEVKGMAA